MGVDDDTEGQKSAGGINTGPVEFWIDLLQGGPELLLRGMTAEENAPISLENGDGR